MNHSDLETLVDSLLDREISEADFLLLEAELQVRPEARRKFYEKLRVDSILRTASEQESELPEPKSSKSWRPIIFAAAAAFALFASATSGWLLGKKLIPVAKPEITEPHAVGFGVVADAAETRWDANSPAVNKGDLLPTGKLHLSSGLLRLELFSGVNVIIEGEAEFELLSSMEMYVTRGKIRAQVPEQAHGFRVFSPTGELVDLGTEFAMQITPDHSDIHVLDGEIEWHPNSAAMRQLRGGDSLRWASDGKSKSIPTEEKSIAEFQDTFDQQRKKRRANWVKQIDQKLANPQLLAYFPMHQSGNGNRRLQDMTGKAQHATVVQARRVADRWGSDGSALDFSPMGSRARVVIPESQGSLTFLCWARIDSLDREFNSLFLTDGHENGEPHWQIMKDGRLFFSVKKRIWESETRRDKHIFYSPPIWNPSMSGRWMQIATTYDIEEREVSHYINGERISREAIPEGYLVENVSIGAASIGNWSEPYRSDPGFAVRNLNGAIDEFSIYSAALSADEISSLYEIGKP